MWLAQWGCAERTLWATRLASASAQIKKRVQRQRSYYSRSKFKGSGGEVSRFGATARGSMPEQAQKSHESLPRFGIEPRVSSRSETLRPHCLWAHLLLTMYYLLLTS